MLLEDAPSILDYICQTCTKHFNDVQLYLNMFNVDFEVKSSIVRGAFILLAYFICCLKLLFKQSVSHLILNFLNLLHIFSTSHRILWIN